MINLPLPIVLLIHIHLLQYPHANSPEYDEHVFDPKTRGLRDRAKTMEDLCYFLVGKIEGKRALKTLLSTYPCSQPSDSTAFRAGLTKYLEGVRAKATRTDSEDASAGWWWKDVVVRKSTLEECAGERFERIIIALSSHALFSCADAAALASNDATKALALLVTLPQSYMDLKKSSDDERRAWERAAAVLRRRQHELRVLKENTTVSTHHLNPKYASHTTEALIALCKSTRENLQATQWSGDDGRRALDLLLGLAGFDDIEASLKPAGLAPVVNVVEATPIHTKTKSLPLPLPTAAAHHPQTLKKLLLPAVKSHAHPPSQDPSIPISSSSHHTSNTNILIQDGLNETQRSRTMLEDALRRMRTVNEGLQARLQTLEEKRAVEERVERARIAAEQARRAEEERLENERRLALAAEEKRRQEEEARAQAEEERRRVAKAEKERLETERLLALAAEEKRRQLEEEKARTQAEERRRIAEEEEKKRLATEEERRRREIEERCRAEEEEKQRRAEEEENRRVEAERVEAERRRLEEEEEEMRIEMERVEEARRAAEEIKRQRMEAEREAAVRRARLEEEACIDARRQADEEEQRRLEEDTRAHISAVEDLPPADTPLEESLALEDSPTISYNHISPNASLVLSPNDPYQAGRRLSAMSDPEGSSLSASFFLDAGSSSALLDEVPEMTHSMDMSMYEGVHSMSSPSPPWSFVLDAAPSRPITEDDSMKAATLETSTENASYEEDKSCADSSVLSTERASGHEPAFESDGLMDADLDEFEGNRTAKVDHRYDAEDENGHEELYGEEEEEEEVVYEGYSVTLRDILVRAGDSTFAHFDIL
ncbi:hypothetical protein OF83DRAFT_1142519, partial [Amylostereum chailletii]